jgi:hypothetical protein
LCSVGLSLTLSYIFHDLHRLSEHAEGLEGWSLLHSQGFLRLLFEQLRLVLKMGIQMLFELQISDEP